MDSPKEESVSTPADDCTNGPSSGSAGRTEKPKNKLSDPYLLDNLSNACDVLKCIDSSGSGLKLSEIIRKTGLNRTVAFRIVHTFSEKGLLERSADLRYRSRLGFLANPQFRIGYAAQADEDSFSAAVTAGIRLAAARRNIEIVLLDNCYSATSALKNARKLAACGVDLVLDFQTHTRVAPAISAIFREAGLPLVAIEVPHPDAFFYGADNYRAGALAGRVLGQWAKQHWNGQVDQILLLGVETIGSVPQLRLSGARAGIRKILVHVPETSFAVVEAKWDFLRAFEAVRKHLRHVPPFKTLITGINDMIVLGGLRAFEEAGRSQDCVAVSMGGIPEARSELTREGTRLIGSVGFFPELYGADIIRIALDILEHREVPPAVYARHELLTARNVSNFYPIELAKLGSHTPAPATLAGQNA